MQISARNLAHKYSNIQGGSAYAIRDINLTIEDHDEFIFILGHTGSGKSTLIQHLNLLLTPSEGVVDILGINMKKNYKLSDIRRRVGLVFQFSDYQLFEETCIKDVMFGPKNFKFKNYADLAKGALEKVKFDKDLYERSPFTLSGGQMRKVAIAGVLASNPAVMILDEPTVGLDKYSEDQIMSVVKELNEKDHKSIIIVTHDMDLVSKYAKRILILDNTKLVFDGTKEELFCNDELIERTALDYPTSMKIAKKLNEQLGIKMDTNCYSVEDIVKSLEVYYG